MRYHHGMSSLAATGDSLHEDHRVFLHAVSFRDYQRLLRLRGEARSPRMTFIDGVVELMSPSQDHESIAKTIARLIEAWAEENGVDLQGYKSWTVKSALLERGVEPDECYVVGRRRPAVPDLVLEVVWTSGGLDKLEAYRRLGVKEVWFWAEGALSVYRAAGGRWQKARKSGVLAGIDVELIARYVDPARQTAAVKQYRAALRRR